AAPRCWGPTVGRADGSSRTARPHGAASGQRCRKSCRWATGRWSRPPSRPWCPIRTSEWSRSAAAGSVDPGLRFLSFLELYRTDVAERRMTTRRVVEPFDVVEHVSTSLLPGSVHLPGRALGLQ